MSCYLFGFSFNKDTEGKWELILPLDWYQAPVMLPEEAGGGCLHPFWNKALRCNHKFLGSCFTQSGKNFLRLKFLDNSSEILGVLSAGRRVVNSPPARAELAQVKEKRWVSAWMVTSRKAELAGTLSNSWCYSWCKALHFSIFQGFFSFSFT